MDKEDKKDKIANQDMKFKVVHKVWGQAEAEVIKSFLESHGIPSLTRGLVVQSIHAFSVDGLGEIKILVAEKDFELAKELLKKHKSP